MPNIPQKQRSNVLACYTLWLATGSTLVCRAIKADTMKRYLKAVDDLASARSLVSPQYFGLNGEKNKDTEDILRECKRWEQMPNRREPITNEMMVYLVKTAEMDPNQDSLLNAVTDFLVMGEYGGFRKSEWLQDTKEARKGKYARNVDDTSKAFILSDFAFRKNKRALNCDEDTALSPDDADQVFVTWRFQKNGNNGETLPYSRNNTTPQRCFVRRAVKVRARAQRLHVRSDSPIAVFKDDNGKVQFISNKHVERILQLAATKVHNITSPKELARWTCHSIRVGACVRLQLLNKPEHFIQTRLRWTSKAWQTYLRNLPELADAHNSVIDALAEDLAAN